VKRRLKRNKDNAYPNTGVQSIADGLQVIACSTPAIVEGTTSSRSDRRGGKSSPEKGLAEMTIR
jgi:hypothetical protein